MRRLIWPNESFGDFDHAVNIAIGKLRAALGDSAETPWAIETRHRRGYRFIAPVAVNGAAVPPTEAIATADKGWGWKRIALVALASGLVLAAL
ncbi:MAG TPA: helix-turn-helix domain-containing protein [Terriglobales bacterium]|nr:helix-turn-helix domain-containing protein [Terriglobales bacterium]